MCHLLLPSHLLLPITTPSTYYCNQFLDPLFGPAHALCSHLGPIPKALRPHGHIKKHNKCPLCDLKPNRQPNRLGQGICILRCKRQSVFFDAGDNLYSSMQDRGLAECMYANLQMKDGRTHTYIYMYIDVDINIYIHMFYLYIFDIYIYM